MTLSNRFFFFAFLTALQWSCTAKPSVSKVSDNGGANSIIKVLIPSQQATAKYFLVSAPNGSTDAKFCEFANNQCIGPENNLVVSNPIGNRSVFKGDMVLSATSAYRVSLMSQGQLVTRVMDFGGAQTPHPLPQPAPQQQNNPSGIDPNLNMNLKKKVNGQLVQTNFAEVVGSAKYVLIGLSADWCGPCRQFAGTMLAPAKTRYFTKGICKSVTLVDNLEKWIPVGGPGAQEESYQLDGIAPIQALSKITGVQETGISFPSLFLYDVENNTRQKISPDPSFTNYLPAVCKS